MRPSKRCLIALALALAWSGTAHARPARRRAAPPTPPITAPQPPSSIFSRPPPPPNDGIIHWNTPNADGNLGGPGAGGGGGG